MFKTKLTKVQISWITYEITPNIKIPTAQILKTSK
jgi:hypothetical protein